MIGSVPKDGRHARGHSTRVKILYAAERLFAEHGIASVSLKDISVATNQKNNGVIQYHFKDRANLIRQIVNFRAKETEEIREGLLKKVALSKGRLEVRDYVSAFVYSLASALDDQNYFIRLLARLLFEWGDGPYASVPESTIKLLKSEMLALMPHMSEGVLEQRWQIMTSTTVQVLANCQTAHRRNKLTAPLDELLHDLVSFLTAGLLAPIEPLAKSPKARPARVRASKVHIGVDDASSGCTNKPSDLKSGRSKI